MTATKSRRRRERWYPPLTWKAAYSKKCFAYEAHTACDKHNFVLDVHVIPGNVHDSVAFDPLYNERCKHYPKHKTVVADSACKTPWICKRIFESGCTRPKTKENGHP
ncbi:MAG: transposase [Provencibacterium sp.]|nr:transposase [Provencibacterium sp.]